MIVVDALLGIVFFLIFVAYFIECVRSSTHGYTHNHDPDPAPHVDDIIAESPSIYFSIQVASRAIIYIPTLMRCLYPFSATTLRHGRKFVLINTHPFLFTGPGTGPVPTVTVTATRELRPIKVLAAVPSQMRIRPVRTVHTAVTYKISLRPHVL
jgi:hypothetical protein